MATKTGLLLTITVRGNTRSLGKVDDNKSMDTLVCLFAEEYGQLFLEFFRPSRTTDNNLLPSAFPSDRALPRTVLVSNKPVLVAIVVASVYNYIHNY